MKVPRVDDFDPNAKKATLKSSFDNMPSIEKPKKTGQPVYEPKITQTNPVAQYTERPNARTVVRPNHKRIITRNSFEIYEDQMDSLRKIAFKEKMEGKVGSMSAMVREAIDSFLKENPTE